MNNVKMKHEDTGELITLDLGTNPKWALRIIQDHEVIGYRLTAWNDAFNIIKQFGIKHKLATESSPTVTYNSVHSTVTETTNQKDWEDFWHHSTDLF